MLVIKTINARELLDSRGNPTVEVEITSTEGHIGRGMVPSGASTGSHEALELRDQDPNRYHGKGVLKAVSNIKDKITPKLIGESFGTQEQFDEFLLSLDGTPNKQELGANSILALSIAFSRLLSAEKNEQLYRILSSGPYTLPRPMCNVINGGQHASNNISFQEFMIVPLVNTSFNERIRACSEVFHTLKKLLKDAGKSTGVGDEGGFAPDLDSAEQALEFMGKAIQSSGYLLGKDFGYALDVAASEFYENGNYLVNKNGTTLSLSSNELAEYYEDLISQFPIISIEDPFAEDDWNAWQQFTTRLGDKLQIVGDDLLVTNPQRLERAITEGSCNAILIKPNQIGSVLETLQTIELAQANNFSIVISHRSGETEDTFIADLAVATNAGQIKTGSLSRTDRVAKYNQLMRIEEGLV